MADKAHIVVAGAGAVGRTIAWRLAAAGLRVTVIDPAPIGANASGVAAGMLAPAFESLLDETSHGHFGWLAEARDRWLGLAGEIGLELSREGAVSVGAPALADAWVAELARQGAGASRLSNGEARELGAPAGQAAVFTPEDWRLDAGPALRALGAAAASRGAMFRPGRVVAWRDGAALTDDGAATQADALVLASGPASGLAPEQAALTPIKGHILRASGDFGRGPAVRAAGVYLCRAEGEAVLGATMEAGLADTEVDPAVVARLLASAGSLVTPLGSVAWRASAGVRASTPDGLPLVGQSRAGHGVMLAVGARRNGWLLAPTIAEVVLDHLQGRPKRAAATRFDPARPALASPC